MPVINNVKADHHVFIVTGVVDGEVCQEQARRKWSKLGDTSVLHWHDSETECGKSPHKVYGEVEYIESSQVKQA